MQHSWFVDLGYETKGSQQVFTSFYPKIFIFISFLIFMKCKEKSIIEDIRTFTWKLLLQSFKDYVGDITTFTWK